MSFVYREYRDLLTEEERQLYESFKSLSVDAQKTFVRIVSRSKDTIRQSKLQYQEINNIAHAVEELVSQRLIHRNAPQPSEQLLGLFTKAELIRLFPTHLSTSQTKQEQLDSVIEQLSESSIQQICYAFDDLLSCPYSHQLGTYFYCFFGNGRQSLTDFILNDLGVVRYEMVPMIKESRYFQNREELENLRALDAFNEWFDEAKENDIPIEDMVLLFNQLNKPANSTNLRRYERAANQLGKWCERNESLVHAQQIYSLSQLPPSRERRARILFKQNQYQQAWDLCKAIEALPYNDEEQAFSRFFQTKIAKKLDIPNTVKAIEPAIPEEIITLDIIDELSVEQTAALHYSQQNGVCFYVENSLWTTLFGLICWDIIFAPLPAVFCNQFQMAPSDINQTDFYSKRKACFDERFQALENNSYDFNEMFELFYTKQNTASTFIYWDINISLLEMALEYIPSKMLAKILKAIALNPKENRAGFPDLIHFKDDGGFELIEIKGPGDRLQKNQQRWFQRFLSWNIPAKLVNVQWQTQAAESIAAQMEE